MKEGNYLLISIQDKGVGIEKEYLQKIFDPYFTTKENGTGLGLATSYSIIKKHGGIITVDSVLNSGTTFKIYIPATSQNIPTKRDAHHKRITQEHEQIEQHTGIGLMKWPEINCRTVAGSRMENQYQQNYPVSKIVKCRQSAGLRIIHSCLHCNSFIEYYSG